MHDDLVDRPSYNPEGYESPLKKKSPHAGLSKKGTGPGAKLAKDIDMSKLYTEQEVLLLLCEFGMESIKYYRGDIDNFNTQEWWNTHKK